MIILTVASKQDPASMKMAEFFVEEYKPHRINDTTYQSGKLILKIIEETHLYANTAKLASSVATNDEIEGIVFLSKHSSKARIKSITVHPVGNISEAILGGLEGVLGMSYPDIMTETLRNMKKNNVNDEIEVTFEATHHGPFSEVPTFYLEIGTTEEEWTSPQLLRCVLKSFYEAEHNSMPNYVGIGGGHYAPKFSQYVFSHRINVGHILPKYQRDHIVKDSMLQAVQKTPNCRGFLMDFKGCNSDMRKVAREVSGELGIEMIEI